MIDFRNPGQNWEIIVQRISGRHRSTFHHRDNKLNKGNIYV